MFYLFLFIFGTAVGSFLNVLIDRLPNGESVMGRSQCDYCHHKLSWFDLIPIVSFFLLKGKCRYCHRKISWQYLLVELLTGIAFVAVSVIPSGARNLATEGSVKLFNYASLDPSSALGGLRMTIMLGIVSCLIVIFFSDLKYHIIPDSIQIALFVFALLLLPFQGQSLYWIFANRAMVAFIIAAPIFFLHWMTSGRAMGFGDVKLSFTIGFLLGIKAGFLALYFAFIIGGIVGLILILLGRKKLKSKIAFGPFLVLGVIIMLFWQKGIFEIIKKIYGF